MKKNFNTTLCALMAVHLLFAGCASTPTPYPPATVTVNFDEDIHVSNDFVVNDPDDPEQLIRFGILLFRRGNYEKAREYFLKANKMGSADGSFERATYSAAMLSVLKSGKISEFAAMELFFEKTYLSESEKINPSSEIAGLMALGRYARGEKEALPISTPNSVRKLLQNLNKF